MGLERRDVRQVFRHRRRSDVLVLSATMISFQAATRSALVIPEAVATGSHRSG
jgi:hypothetical protein